MEFARLEHPRALQPVEGITERVAFRFMGLEECARPVDAGWFRVPSFDLFRHWDSDGLSFGRHRGCSPYEGAHVRKPIRRCSMQVREIMTLNPFCCTADTALEDVAKAMVEHDCGEIPIVRNSRDRTLIGVVTDRDIVCRLVANGRNPRGRSRPNPACRRRSSPSARRRPSRSARGSWKRARFGACPSSMAAGCAVESSLRPTSPTTPRGRFTAELVKDVSQPARV